MASFSVRLPHSTGRTSAPSSRMRKTFSPWRSTSTAPMYTEALDAEQRRRRRRGDAVLAGSGLGDEAALAHALGEERLTDHVVELVRARVGEVLPLEQQPDRRAARSGAGIR